MVNTCEARAEYWSRLAQFAKKQEADNRLLSDLHYQEYLSGFGPAPVVAHHKWT